MLGIIIGHNVLYVNEYCGLDTQLKYPKQRLTAIVAQETMDNLAMDTERGPLYHFYQCHRYLSFDAVKNTENVSASGSTLTYIEKRASRC